MKTLLLANQKGGVGKSTLACQQSYYFAERLGKRVLLIDLDHQGNTSKAVGGSGMAVRAAMSASQVFTQPDAIVDNPAAAALVYLQGDDSLTKLEQQLANRNQFAANLRSFLGRVADGFDVCIIDTNPNPDIRMVASLVAAQYVLAPIQLNQEALDGIGKLYRDVLNVQTKLNPSLQFIGVLPNMVAATPFQKANLQQLATHYRDLLITLPDGRPALIQNRTAIAEAQAASAPLWASKKTSAREAWQEVEPTFACVAAAMGIA